MNRVTKEFVLRQRIGHLATADRIGNPVVVPICFATTDNDVLYTPLDSKPKSVEPHKLKRLANINENASVSVVFDTYSEDWNKLAYVIVFGEATLLTDARERACAENLLREKYPQYETILSPGAPIIRVGINRAKSWGLVTD